MAIGRISGPLLKANLLREGVDLAFETDLLYLDVNNNRVGIRTSNPQYDLDVNGTTRVPGLEVSTLANIADIEITGNTISSNSGVLTLGTADNVIYQNRLLIDSFQLQNNVISTTLPNENIEINPDGSGTVEIFANTNVYGNIVATGSITAEGDITIGDEDTDSVTFNAEIASDIIPDITNTYSLGSDPFTGGKEWAEVYTDTFYATSVVTTAIEVDGVDLSLRQGNIYYVAENGNDTFTGDHPNDPFASVQQALSVAAPGDTIHIFPGVYTEAFPLTIPSGVTIKGHSIRSVKIVPTVATNTNDAFLLNGETTIEDVTISNFYSPGYAFRFAPGFTVTSRSPYIKNVTVITFGTVTSTADPRGFDSADAGRGAYLDGAVATLGSVEAAALFHAVTFITPGVDALTITNGVRVEWLNCFTYYANRGLYAVDGTTGLYGTGTTAIRFDGVTGTPSVGDTIDYYNIDGTTIIESAVIESISDDKYFLSGKQNGFVLAKNRTGKTVIATDNASLSTDIKRFGSASLYLDGIGDYITIAPTPDFGFANDDFTVEGWFYPTSTVSVSRLFDFRSGSITDSTFAVSAHNLNLRVFVNGVYEIISSANLSLNSWNHVAYSRASNVSTLYLNGISIGSWTDTTNYGATKPLVVGALFDGSGSFFQGYVDDVRIIKGASIVPPIGGPSSTLLVTEQTVLMLRFDGANGSQEFIDEAIYPQDIRFSNGSSAKYITYLDYTDFGGEIRSIGSACVYGNYGAYGDGAGVLMYLISQNLAYIGSGKDDSNDTLTVIQDNEIVELNGSKIRYNTVDHKGDFRVGDLFYVDQETGIVTFSSSDVNISTSTGVTIVTNGSTTTITGENVDTGNLRLSGNTISSVLGDINLAADSGIVRIDSTGALVVPSGDTFSRPLSPELGMIRFNTETNLFEGYDGNWISLSGVYDLDLDTRITAELTPGSNDNVIRFYIQDVETVSIDADKVTAPRYEVDDIYVDDNTIGTMTLDTDLILSANGTGSVLIDSIGFKDTSITNISEDSVLYFNQTGNGYFKISGSAGVVLPVGTSSERPAEAFRETGMTRFNTDQGYLEIWNGSSWVSVAGASGSITYTTAEDIALEYILTLG